MSQFEELGVMPELIRAIEELGWMLPTPVQAECVPLILGGGDVMAAAETGSGKTGAFSLPVLQIVHETIKNAQSSNIQSNVEFKLNSNDRDSLLNISYDGLKCQNSADTAWAGCRATAGVSSAGKFYYEAKPLKNGLFRIGWSTLSSTLQLGMDTFGFGFGSTGKKSTGKNFEDYGEAFGYGDVIGCHLDLENQIILYTKNGKSLGIAFQIPDKMSGNIFYPAILLKNSEVQVNFGKDSFQFQPLDGFIGLSKAPANVISSVESTSLKSNDMSNQMKSPLCVILEPSRDLAEQTHKCIDDFKKYLTSPNVSNELFVGGIDAKDQLRALREGVHIITGTPGRIIDFVQSGKININKVKFFVLDEADRLLDTGNQGTILELYKRFPKHGKGTNRLQVLMFSATLHSDEVIELAKKICQNPILVDLKGKDAVPETVDHVLVRINPEEDKTWLQSQPKVYTDNCHVIDKIGPNVRTMECYSEAVKRLKPRILQRLIDTFKMEQCLIFCRTNFDCDNLEKFLNELGGGRAFTGKAESGKENPYSCVVLAGGRAMDQRRQALQAFKDGDVRFLICTDVAARGIDIKGLPYVINMTLPDKSEDYVHRVGRVGRADTMGLAISLVSTATEKVWYCSIRGYKPWLEPNQQNTRTNDQGGQTIWYDEPKLLNEVEMRLGTKIDPLGPDLSLPKKIGNSSSTKKYGQERSGGASKEVMEHLEQIKQNVEELGKLEWEAQTSFLMLSHKFEKRQQWPSLKATK